MAEPVRDDEPERGTEGKENEQELIQILNRQRRQVISQILAPRHFLNALTVYLLLVGTIIAFGVFAFYSGHKIIQEIVFFACLVLMVGPLIAGAIWYFLPKVSTVNKRALERFKQSTLAGLAKHPALLPTLRISTIAFILLGIGFDIRKFPTHPRFSLAMIMLEMFGASTSIALWLAASLERKTYKTFTIVADLSEEMLHSASITRDLVDHLLKEKRARESASGKHSTER